MKIYPDTTFVDCFAISLSSQEMENIREAISEHLIATTPWGMAAIRAIDNAITSNKEYRGRMWNG